jgi:hypothetical protein
MKDVKRLRRYLRACYTLALVALWLVLPPSEDEV